MIHICRVFRFHFGIFVGKAREFILNKCAYSFKYSEDSTFLAKLRHVILRQIMMKKINFLNNSLF